MFSLATAATLLLAASSVSALVIPRSSSSSPSVPAGYRQDILESYAAYHKRYTQLDCEDKHGSQFFTDCCHPMKTGETLTANRKPYCTPGSTAAPPSNDDGDCTDPEEPTTPAPAPASVKKSTPPKSTSTSAPKSTPKTPAKIVQPTDTKTSSSAKAPAPTKSSSDSGSGGGGVGAGVSVGGVDLVNSGHATFFTQNHVAGACGIIHQDSDFVAALTSKFYGDFGKKSPNCGRAIEIKRTSNGKTVKVTAADGCPTCDEDTDLDLSVAAFEALGTKDEGEFDIEWNFV